MASFRLDNGCNKFSITLGRYIDVDEMKRQYSWRGSSSSSSQLASKQTTIITVGVWVFVCAWIWRDKAHRYIIYTIYSSSITRVFISIRNVKKKCGFSKYRRERLWTEQNRALCVFAGARASTYRPNIFLLLGKVYYVAQPQSLRFFFSFSCYYFCYFAIVTVAPQTVCWFCHGCCRWNKSKHQW